MHLYSIFRVLYPLVILFLVSSRAAFLATRRPFPPHEDALVLDGRTSGVSHVESKIDRRASAPTPILLLQKPGNESYLTPLQISNATLSNHDIIIKYPVPKCSMTLDLWGLSSDLPHNEALISMHGVIGKIYGSLAGLPSQGKSGRSPIDDGYFNYSAEYIEGSTVDFVVGDFRELGRPLTWYMLCDVARGISEFLRSGKWTYTEMTFDVEVEGIGRVGLGHFGWTKKGPTSTPTSTVATVATIASISES